MVDTVTQRSVGPRNCHDQSMILHLERILSANQITAVLSLRSRIWTWRRSKEKIRTTITCLSPQPSTCLVHRSSVPPSTLVHLLHINTLPRLPARWWVAVEVALALEALAPEFTTSLKQRPVGHLETTKNTFLLLKGCPYHQYQKH